MYILKGLSSSMQAGLSFKTCLGKTGGWGSTHTLVKIKYFGIFLLKS